MTKDEIIKALRDMAKYPTVTLPRDCEALKAAADLLAQQESVQSENEPLEYWNAVEGWVKIDEVREHFDSVGCGTIYKTAGEDRVPVYAVPPPCPTCEALARTMEAKLKERNNG